MRHEALLVEADRAGMSAVADLAASGRLRASIADSFALRDAAKAHERGQAGHTTGKIVLVVR